MSVFQKSVILPLAIRTMVMPRVWTRAPVGRRSGSFPVWVPEACQRAATLSLAEIKSSISVLQSGKAA